MDSQVSPAQSTEINRDLQECVANEHGQEKFIIRLNYHMC